MSETGARGRKHRSWRLPVTTSQPRKKAMFRRIASVMLSVSALCACADAGEAPKLEGSSLTLVEEHFDFGDEWLDMRLTTASERGLHVAVDYGDATDSHTFSSWLDDSSDVAALTA